MQRKNRGVLYCWYPGEKNYTPFPVPYDGEHPKLEDIPGTFQHVALAERVVGESEDKGLWLLKGRNHSGEISWKISSLDTEDHPEHSQ